MTEDTLYEIHLKLQDELWEEAKGGVDFITHCSHNYNDNSCDCRKPSVGQWKQHLKFGGHAVLEASKKNFWMVGDMVSDMVFAENIGAKPIFLTCGLSSYSDCLHTMATCVMSLDLPLAVNYILKESAE